MNGVYFCSFQRITLTLLNITEIGSWMAFLKWHFNIYAAFYSTFFIGQSTIRMVKVLIQKKKLIDCKRVFRKLLEKRDTLAPFSILVDFEKFILQAAPNIFQCVEFVGCFFYIVRCLCGRIESEGLVNNYPDNEELRIFIMMLLVLSFVPPDDFPLLFDKLIENFPDELELVYDYWKENYIGRQRQYRRVYPNFQKSFMNMESHIEDGLPRTKN